MAKRFTDTDKWKKPFIRGLQTPYKILWLYILDECDHAGVWQVDFDVAKIKIGEPTINEQDALKCFGDRVIVKGDKWFINDFVDFQYGELNPANRVHKSVIDIISKFQNKPLNSPFKGAKDKDKDKEQDKNKELSIVDLAFNDFLEMRRKIKKPATERAVELLKQKLDKLAPNNDELKVEIINQSIVKGWQDFFEIKSGFSSTPQQPVLDFNSPEAKEARRRAFQDNI